MSGASSAGANTDADSDGGGGGAHGGQGGGGSNCCGAGSRSPFVSPDAIAVRALMSVLDPRTGAAARVTFGERRGQPLPRHC